MIQWKEINIQEYKEDEEPKPISIGRIRRLKTYTIEEDLKNWCIHLKQQLANRNYKKALKEIASKGLISKFKRARGGYKIIILYIRAKLKIIEKKIFKYRFNLNENNKLKHQITHCFSYSNNILEELNLLILNISDNNLYDNDYYNDIKKRNYKIELFDEIIRCHFDYIYIMSLLHYKVGNCAECISYLSLFLTLYKESKPYILSFHTLFKIEKCFILLSKIYILNNDHSNALSFLNESIKVCFKQIIFQVYDLYYGVFVGEKENLEIKEKEDILILKDSRIKRIILNIVIIFLYQGICNENLANIKKATAFYKQCEWFTRIFLAKNNPILYKLVYKLKKSGIIACNIIDLINDKIEESEEKGVEYNEDNDEDAKNKKYLRNKNKYYNTNKYKGLIRKLQELKIKEIDTVNKFEKNKNIIYPNTVKREGTDKNLFLSNIRLLEAYLRNDFKYIINDMKKINIFDLDYKARVKIQKALNKIYFEQNQKIIKDKNKSNIQKTFQKKNTYKINEEKININNKGLSTQDYRSFDSISDFRKRLNSRNKIYINLSKNKLNNNQSSEIISLEKNNSSKNSSNFKFYFSNREATSPKYHKLNFSSSSSYILNTSRFPNQNNKSESKFKESNIIKEKSKIRSLTINKSSKYKLIHPENQKIKDFFNKKYLKKREYIKKLSDRELLFQKSILKSKNTRRFSFQYFNKAEAEQNANNSFTKIESIVLHNPANNFWKESLLDEEYKEYILNNKLENALLLSLDNKAFSKYKMNRRRIHKKDEKKILKDNSKYNKKLVNINNANKNTLNELNQKLNKLYENVQKKKNEIIEHKKEIRRQIYKKFYRNKSAFNRSTIREKMNLNNKN